MSKWKVNVTMSLGRERSTFKGEANLAGNVSETLQELSDVKRQAIECIEQAHDSIIHTSREKWLKKASVKK